MGRGKDQARNLKSGQRIALGASLALAVACTLLVVLRLLPGEAGRHLKLLHARPEHFLEIVEAAENTPEREAVLRYIETPAGTRRLCLDRSGTRNEAAACRPSQKRNDAPKSRWFVSAS